MSRIVITGAPGAGKTTLLLALQACGYLIAGDSARAIIQDRRQRGLSPRPDPLAFAQETLQRDIANFVQRASSPGPIFFERGVLECRMRAASHPPPKRKRAEHVAREVPVFSEGLRFASLEGDLPDRCRT